jgi:hypothetical protein
MRFPLSLDCTNLPNWGAREGIRELLQNGVDAETEFSAPLNVSYRKETAKLVIKNDGTVIPLKALLTGFTTKRGKKGLRGQYGEGLPQGVLSLLRAGHSVKIRSGSEVWVPSIEAHEQAGADVLVFNISKGHKDENRVAIEIGNISEETYKALPEHFLFLSKETTSDRVKTSMGTLLLDKRYAGNIYAQGIWVCNDPKLTMGYDFSDIETDRDRKMVASYDLQLHCRRVWQEALATRPDLVKKFIVLLNEQAPDVEGIDAYSTYAFSDEVKTAVAADFTEKHGKDAVPVRSLLESAEVEHLGRTGRIVPMPLKAILESVLGTVEQVKERFRSEAQRLYGWSELGVVEKTHLEQAIALVTKEEEVTLGDIDITDFRDPGLRGLYRDGKILLSKSILADRDLTLRVLVHEVAHRSGGDGEKGHVSEIERIWAGITGQLRNLVGNV